MNKENGNGSDSATIPKYDNGGKVDVPVTDATTYRSVSQASLVKDNLTDRTEQRTVNHNHQTTTTLSTTDAINTIPTYYRNTRTYRDALLAKTQQCFERRSAAKSEIPTSHSLQLIPSSKCSKINS